MSKPQVIVSLDSSRSRQKAKKLITGVKLKPDDLNMRSDLDDSLSSISCTSSGREIVTNIPLSDRNQALKPNERKFFDQATVKAD